MQESVLRRVMNSTRDIPKKSWMVRREFAEKRAQEHIALVAALLESCEWCAERGNRERLITTLARPEYVGVPATTLRRGVEEFCLFPDRANAGPSGDKVAWTLELMRSSGICPQPELLNMALARRAVRLDHLEQVARLLSANLTEKNMKLSELKSSGHWPTLVASFLYFDFFLSGLDAPGPLGVQIGESLHLSTQQKGLMVAVPILSGAILRIVLGLAVDRFGAKATGCVAQLIVISGLLCA